VYSIKKVKLVVGDHVVVGRIATTTKDGERKKKPEEDS